MRAVDMKDEVVKALKAGDAHYREGRYFEAGQCCRQALALDPRNTDAFNLLGLTYLKTGLAEQAIDVFRKALSIRPIFADANLNLGSAYCDLGRWNEAAVCFEKAARQAPRKFKAFFQLGIAQRQLGRFDEAAKHLARALALAPDRAETASALGSVRLLQDRMNEAEEAFRKATLLGADVDVALRRLGLDFLGRRQIDLARKVLLYALRQASPNSNARYLLGQVEMAAGDYGKAVEYYRDAVGEDADFADAWIGLATACNQLYRFDEGEAAAAKAYALNPASLDALFALGAAYYGLEKVDAAIALAENAVVNGKGEMLNINNALAQTLMLANRLERAISMLEDLIPSCADPAPLTFNLAVSYLNRGELARGWDLYASRFALTGCPDIRKFSKERWDRVSDLAGKRVLVWKEQGIGDEMTFASALPDLIVRAGKVIVETTPKLVPIFARSFPDAEIRPEDRSRDQTRDDFDVHLPIGDLFCGLRRSIEDFPSRPAYLKADPARVAHWRDRLAALGPTLKVGFAWRSNLQTIQRSMAYFTSLGPWAPILSVPDVDFICLQPGWVSDELIAVRRGLQTRIHQVSEVDMFNDLDEVGALMSALDLVIAPGQAVVIQSAALGIPTWVMLLRNNHWDLLGTQGMPWLPKAEIFLRNFGQGWSDPVERIAARLGEWAQTNTRNATA
ncbi:MAG: tetratricopeptide repeat protein [Rhodospirillales bacterium]|nr:tetratricopeptide repeat protein [Rhodospirillales bacterium]